MNPKFINKNSKNLGLGASPNHNANSKSIKVLDNEDRKFLRTISIELLNSQNDIIKNAGVLDKILFWQQKRKDPVLRQITDKLDENTRAITDKIKQLVPAIKKVKYYRKNLDFQGTSQAIKDVENTISDMYHESREADSAAQQVEKRVVRRETYTREDYEKDEVRNDMLQSAPDYVRDLTNRLAKGEQVPFSQTHMAQYSTIDIKDVPFQRLMEEIKKAVFSRSLTIGRSQEDLNSQIDTHAAQFVQNLKDAIRQGTVQLYDIAAPSEQIKRRPILQMRVVVVTPEVLLPGDTEEQNIFIHPGQVWLTDMVERKYLSFMGVRSVIMTGYREPAVPKEEPEQIEASQRIEKLTKLADACVLEDFKNDGIMLRSIKRAIWKNKLPTTKTLICLENDIPFEFQVRYAQILSKALRIELDAECEIHRKDNNIEIQADLPGSKEPAIKAVKGMVGGISAAYKLATGQDVKTNVYFGIKSKYALIEPVEVEKAFRKFAMQMWSK